MVDPKETDIGRIVVYTGNHNGPLEQGVITSFNEYGVFVRYGLGTTSQLTSRRDLEWVSGGDSKTNERHPE